MWLNDRLASAYTAALVLDAAPNAHGVRTRWPSKSSTRSAPAPSP